MKCSLMPYISEVCCKNEHLPATLLFVCIPAKSLNLHTWSSHDTWDCWSLHNNWPKSLLRRSRRCIYIENPQTIAGLGIRVPCPRTLLSHLTPIEVCSPPIHSTRIDMPRPTRNWEIWDMIEASCCFLNRGLHWHPTPPTLLRSPLTFQETMCRLMKRRLLQKGLDKQDGSGSSQHCQPFSHLCQLHGLAFVVQSSLPYTSIPKQFAHYIGGTYIWKFIFAARGRWFLRANDEVLKKRKPSFGMTWN